MARTRSSRLGISFTRPCCWSASSAAETWPVASSSTADFRAGSFWRTISSVWLCAFRLPAVARRGGPLIGCTRWLTFPPGQGAVLCFNFLPPVIPRRAEAWRCPARILGRIKFSAGENAEGAVGRFHPTSRSQHLTVLEERGRVNCSGLVHAAGEQPGVGGRVVKTAEGIGTVAALPSGQ